MQYVPKSMHEFLGVKLLCTFRGYVGLNFSPIRSHVNENEKKKKLKTKKNV